MVTRRVTRRLKSNSQPSARETEFDVLMFLATGLIRYSSSSRRFRLQIRKSEVLVRIMAQA